MPLQGRQRPLPEGQPIQMQKIFSFLFPPKESEKKLKNDPETLKTSPEKTLKKES
jgi:hypothetical protein